MINTKRLKIIPLEEKHLEPLRELRNDPTTNHWLTDISPISEIQQKDWFEKISRDRSKMYLAITLNQPRWKPEYQNINSGVSGAGGGSINYTAYYPFIGILRSDEWDRANRSVRIGIDIVSEFRGQGYGSEAFLAFIDYLFKQQNMKRVWLLVADANKVARKLYEKLSFKEEGKQKKALFRDGKYWDYISMSILEEEWTKNTK